MAYYEVEPFGEERADLRAGIIAATIANVNRNTKKHRKPYTPADFMPFSGPKKEEKIDRNSHSEKTPDDLLEQVRTLNALFGGKDKTRQK